MSTPVRRYGGPSGYGFKADPEGHVVTGFHVLKLTLALAITSAPLSVDWRPYVTGNGGPGILNQFRTSSCTGHSTSGACATRMAIKKTPIECPTPIGNYTYSRCIDRVDDSQPLVDEGAAPNENMRALTEWGTPPKGLWGGYTTDPNSTQPVPDPAHINDEPTVKQDEAASAFELKGYYTINSIGDQRVRDLITALAAGFPVCFAVRVDQAFEDYTGGVLGAPDANNILGGHYIYACGYTWDGKDPSSIEIIFTNSWDTTWGEGGFGRGNRAFVDGMSFLYVMDVKAAA